MRFVFRSDASINSGTGHVMRGIGIIQELIRREYPVYFVGNTGEIPWINELIQNESFAAIYRSESDFIPNNDSDVLIFDSYSLPVDHSFIRIENWKHVIVIGDEFTPSYSACLKINPTFALNSKSHNYLLSLTGPSFIPIRNGIKRVNLSQSNDYVRICIVGGGVDQQEFVPAISNMLSRISGNFVANFFTNKKHLVSGDARFRVFPIGKMLDEIANKSHVALTTASTSSIEFMARGCGVGIACSVKNQENYYYEFTKLGICLPIGKYTDKKWNLDAVNIKKLVKSKEQRLKISSAATSLLDMNGTERIVSRILDL
jgi:spore coat polysaccharide biosynthesis predicted glycosyltransferase SpsG